MKNLIENIDYYFRQLIADILGIFVIIFIAPIAFLLRAIYEYFKNIGELFSIMCGKSSYLDLLSLYKLRYAICCILKPQQSYILNKLKISWQDKPDLMRDILFAMLIDYLEREEGFSSMQNNLRYLEELKPESTQIKLLKERIIDLTHAYKWIKERPGFDEYYDNYAHNLSQDSKTLDIILKYREYLWV